MDAVELSTTGKAGGSTALRAVTLIALAFTFGNATWAAWDQDLTYDEFFHLEWPRRLLEERTDSRDAFRFDSKTPALMPAVILRKALVSAGVESKQGLRFATRLCSVGYLAVCLLLIFWICDALGREGAWIGVLLAALDPNLAAHASIATSDIAYTLAVLLVAGMLSRVGGKAGEAALVGVAIGLAFAMKYTAVLLVPVSALGLILMTPGAAKQLRNVLFAILAGLFTMGGLYLWVNVFTPIGSLGLESPLLRSIAAAVPWMRVPFPAAVLTGIDMSIAHNLPSLWNCYLFGQEHRGGVWYYFLALWAIKTPVALIAVILSGLWRLKARWRGRTVVMLGGLLLVHLGYFSFFFATQIGLRFALPCIALSCALAAIGLQGTVRRNGLLALACLSLPERAPYFGDPIAFTNLAVWPKSRAYWFAADSNLDYGQNRERVERYANNLGLPLILNQGTVTPGIYVVSANDLVIFNARSHRWLIDHDIEAILVGFTHFGFSITGERFEEYMNAARIAPSPPDFGELCAGRLPHSPPGAQIAFDQNTHPEGPRSWVICVSSRKGVDVGFSVTNGRLLFGRVRDDGSCEAALMLEKQQAWFRVPKGGQSELCIQELTYRRRELQYLTSGYITVRGQGADVALRPAPPFRLFEERNLDLSSRP